MRMRNLVIYHPRNKICGIIFSGYFSSYFKLLFHPSRPDQLPIYTTLTWCSPRQRSGTALCCCKIFRCLHFCARLQNPSRRCLCASRESARASGWVPFYVERSVLQKPFINRKPASTNGLSKKFHCRWRAEVFKKTLEDKTPLPTPHLDFHLLPPHIHNINSHLLCSYLEWGSCTLLPTSSPPRLWRCLQRRWFLLQCQLTHTVPAMAGLELSGKFVVFHHRRVHEYMWHRWDCKNQQTVLLVM